MVVRKAHGSSPRIGAVTQYQPAHKSWTLTGSQSGSKSCLLQAAAKALDCNHQAVEPRTWICSC